MKCDIQILTSFSNPALEYTLDFIFNSVLGLKHEIVSSIEEADSDKPIVLYNQDENAFIQPSQYLAQEEFFGIPPVPALKWNDLPIVFETNGRIPFDLFSAVFFFISRAEEYNSSKMDGHGRFPGKESWAYKSGCLQIPIVDLWIEQLKVELKSRYPELRFKEHEYKWINTYDIDIAFAHKHRPIKRIVGGALKSAVRGQISHVSNRLKVLSGADTDPYDTYAYQKEISYQRASETKYFFLSGGETEFDNALDVSHQGMIDLIKELATHSEIGIHPSYNSSKDKSILVKELDKLERVLGSKINMSRQHFLRVHFPDSFNNLLENGIKQDYSLGFADQLGFRSGTSRVHYFFDLKNNRRTDLELVPLHLMDGTLKDYLKLNAQEAVDRFAPIIQSIKAVDGTFVSLWHNDVLEEGSDWRMVYEEMVKLATP